MTKYLKLNIVQPKPIKIIFCLPASSFTGKFFDGFVDLLRYCFEAGIEVGISRHFSPVIYYARNLCLGGDVLRGEDQKPFNGQINYTHMMWIDSDIVFTPQHFQTLLNHDKDIMSGIYMMSDSKHFATVKAWDEGYFAKNGTFKFMDTDELNDHKGLIEVDYTGFGFMLVKRGVFESLKYPWFRPIFYKMGNCQDFCSEDVGFCRLIAEKGYKIYIDPQVRVGHEKNIVL